MTLHCMLAKLGVLEASDLTSMFLLHKNESIVRSWQLIPNYKSHSKKPEPCRNLGTSGDRDFKMRQSQERLILFYCLRSTLAPQCAMPLLTIYTWIMLLPWNSTSTAHPSSRMFVRVSVHIQQCRTSFQLGMVDSISLSFEKSYTTLLKCTLPSSCKVAKATEEDISNIRNPMIILSTLSLITSIIVLLTSPVSHYCLILKMP